MRHQHRGRIARKSATALAAMTVIVLGTPAIALASTIGSGSGQAGPPGPPGQVAIACPGPHGKPVRFKVHPVQFKLHAKIARLPRNARIRVFCRLGPGCPPAPLRFDMASGSSTMTEVSGPVLAPPEQFAYDGQIYTIMSVNPGAGSFTVFRDNFLFVNNGPAITGATGFLMPNGKALNLPRTCHLSPG
jgi:hypothetical protein